MKTIRYLTGIPRKPLPSGHVVVHNHDGFRVWIAAPGNDDGHSYEVVPCDCGWAPELAEHYRVVLD